MRKLFLIFWFLPILLNGQVAIDFENAAIVEWEESENGRWQADSLEAINGNYSLHHAFDNPSSGHDQVSIAISDLKPDQGTISWHFKVRHSYPPSSANNWSVFLYADGNADGMIPYGSSQGYVLGVNFTGSDDMVKLWKASGGTATSILTTGFNWQENVPADSVVTFELTRTPDGVWTIQCGLGINLNNIETIGSVKDDELTNAAYFGLYYEYSSSQDRTLWLDDVSITGPFIKDTIPPKIANIKIGSSNSLILEFNEPVMDTVMDLNNFLVDQGVGTPVYIERKSAEIIYLNFENPFKDETIHNLEIKNIADLSGNVMPLTTKEFFWYDIKPYDVVINEIMADPDPPVDLPNQEYIELKNNTPYDLQMEGWELRFALKSKFIPPFVLGGDEYLILCDETDTSMFQAYGKVLGLPNMPALNNSGQELALFDSSDMVLSYVLYNPDWYKSDLKSEGGWSLEQIDPANPCTGEENWCASSGQNGGTPGIENSVYGSNPDRISPELSKAVIIEGGRVEVFFNEPYYSETAGDPLFYEIDQSFGTPDSVELIAPEYRKLILVYSLSFESNKLYTLTVKENFSDCAGNKLSDKYLISFGLPEKVEIGDVVINEVLFHPVVGGADYVEIYNRSDKILDVRDLKIATLESVSRDLESVYDLTSEPGILLPQQYLLLTTNPAQLITHYPFSDPSCFIEMEKLPSYPNSGGTVVLLDKWFNTLDEFAYSEEFHFSLLQNFAGVSLERINPDNLTTDKSNWHSAAETVNYGTPGLQNSQYLDKTESSEPVWVSPEVFSPDNDGYRDVVQVFYELSQPGSVANVTIFDSQGRRIRILYKNELLGTSGNFLWDGEDETGRKADIGIYVFLIEVFDQNGNVKAYKKTCVLARRLS